jgi:hypothetical protein
MMSNGNVRTVVEKAGYRRERLPGSIVALRLLDARPETIDAWYEDCSKLMAHWQQGQRLRYLHDIRQAEQVTPHAMERVARVLRQMRYTPVTDGRGAILMNNQTLAGLLRTFFRRRAHANWQIRFFSDEAEAMRWLSD